MYRKMPWTTRKKPTWKKRAPARAPAKKTVVRAVKSVLNREVEMKNTIVTGTELTLSTLTSPASIYVLNTVSQGTNQATRTGNRISPKFLNVRGSLHIQPSDSAQYVRLMVIQSTNDSDGLTDLLETNNSTYGPAGTDVASIYGRLNTTKYRLLASRLCKVGFTNNFYGSYLFNMNMKLSGNMYYDQGSNIPHNRKIFFVVINRRSDNDESTGTNCELTFNSKFYFQDM